MLTTPISALLSCIFFHSDLDDQGQLTLLSVVQSGRNWNTSKILCIPLLSATLNGSDQ